MRLKRWEREFPGIRAREAFDLLANASAFLELPAEDIPNAPAPEQAEQRAIFEKAIAYVRNTIAKLPNFYATRETTHFDDSLPSAPVDNDSILISSRRIVADYGNARGMTGDKSQDRPLHFAGRSSMEVTYRDGAELPQSRTGNKRNSENPAITLTTRGEFGPILTVVFADATQGSVTWGHWEQRNSGRFAVFRYAVPEEQSH